MLFWEEKVREGIKGAYEEKSPIESAERIDKDGGGGGERRGCEEEPVG